MIYANRLVSYPLALDRRFIPIYPRHLLILGIGTIRIFRFTIEPQICEAGVENKNLLKYYLHAVMRKSKGLTRTQCILIKDIQFVTE